MSKELRLLTIHAHPDDESSKGAGTVALYADLGVGTTLVCCTGGEEGDILNPAIWATGIPEWKTLKLMHIRIVSLWRP